MNKNKISDFLLQPYPFYYEGKVLWRIVGLIFLMTVFFNYLFEPFIVYAPEHKMPFFWICVVHGSVSSVLILVFFLSVSHLPNIDVKWRIKEEGLALLALMILIGIGQFLIRDVIYDNPNNWSWKYFVEEIRNTLLVGSLFIALFLPFNYKRLNQRNQEKALVFTSNNLDSKAVGASSVFIQTQVKGDDFQFDPSTFLFAQAEKNYVELYLYTTSGVQKLLKRITIKDLEGQLVGFPHVIKTHRSFLVNLNQVEQVTGNAQGYKLKLKNYPNQVPVSRSMIADFEEKMNKS